MEMANNILYFTKYKGLKEAEKAWFWNKSSQIECLKTNHQTEWHDDHRAMRPVFHTDMIIKPSVF
jgi:hypothetical protein